MSDSTQEQGISPPGQVKLEPIPNKLYFTIGEVSQLCAVPAHRLRYWESKVPGLAQVGRRQNRRYYRREDVIKARRIRELVDDQGMTIEGAVQALETQQTKSEGQAVSRVGRELREIREALQEVSRVLAKTPSK